MKMKRIIASTLIGIALGSFTCYANIASIPPFADLLYNVVVKKVYKNIDEYKIAMGSGSYSIDADAVDENSQQDYNVEDADNSDVDY